MTLVTSVKMFVVFYCLYSTTPALSACSGNPKSSNGVPCASTTRYWDGQMGACGCGTGNSNPFSWQWMNFTGAGSTPIFGAGTWCGSGCGSCYELTPTGYSPTGGTGCGDYCKPIIVMVTNLCPSAGNEQWCSYPVNQYGYGAHFDLMDYQMNGIISKIGWNNPECENSCVESRFKHFAKRKCKQASCYDPSRINCILPSILVPSGKHPLKIVVRVESSVNERVTITSASGGYNQTFSGTGHQTFEPSDLPRSSEETYVVRVEHAVAGEWQQSKVEMHAPHFATPRVGALSVLGFDQASTKPDVVVEFTWSNLEV